MAAVRTGAHGDVEFATVPDSLVLDSVADLPAAIEAHDARANGAVA